MEDLMSLSSLRRAKHGRTLHSDGDDDDYEDSEADMDGSSSSKRGRMRAKRAAASKYRETRQRTLPSLTALTPKGDLSRLVCSIGQACACAVCESLVGTQEQQNLLKTGRCKNRSVKDL